MDDFEHYEICEDGRIQNKAPARVFSLWMFLLMLIAIFFSMLLASFTICLVNPECRKAIPTVHVLLSSPLTGPYIMMALMAGVIIYFMTCLALFVKSANRVVLVASVFVYMSIGVILIVLPFTGWSENWGIFLFIISFLLWMCTVAFSFRGTHAWQLRRIEIVLVCFYAACGITYTVLKFLPAVNSVGLLVVEIVMLATIVLHMVVCLFYVRKVTITWAPH